MKPISRELLHAWRLARSPAMQAVLDRAGLPEPRPTWGVDWVEPDGALYRPVAEGGRVAAIFGVWQETTLLDLVAVSLETRAMRRRLSLALLLGHDRLEAAHRSSRPLTVFPDPLAWLAAERRGGVVLDWRDVGFELGDVPALACADEAMALRLHRALTGFAGKAPPIFITSRQAQEQADVRPIHPAAARHRAVQRGLGRLA
ncbi:MAG: hypothetical protein J0J01_18690 [Reyranella sp.]|uniref:hypothetical protein n=1 Tax=Reyranella sp. TaxID=1929291 RepID=UPI001AC89B1E|nr:hypothetical protein [Reyranella sp.]MBN9088939.1 hypothetical protein [Reyranella sp.]